MNVPGSSGTRKRVTAASKRKAAKEAEEVSKLPDMQHCLADGHCTERRGRRRR